MTQTGKYVFCIAGVPGVILVTLTQTGKYVFCIAGIPVLILFPTVSSRVGGKKTQHRTEYLVPRSAVDEKRPKIFVLLTAHAKHGVFLTAHANSLCF